MAAVVHMPPLSEAVHAGQYAPPCVEGPFVSHIHKHSVPFEASRCFERGRRQADALDARCVSAGVVETVFIGRPSLQTGSCTACSHAAISRRAAKPGWPGRAAT